MGQLRRLTSPGQLDETQYLVSGLRSNRQLVSPNPTGPYAPIVQPRNSQWLGRTTYCAFPLIGCVPSAIIENCVNRALTWPILESSIHTRRPSPATPLALES